VEILDANTIDKPQIEYPCEWGFKIIGRDLEKLEICAKEILLAKEYRCKVGNVSKNGKFYSYNAYCQVISEDERDKIYKDFKTHKDVKMVM
jgi:putative lipoic acid-binding regulatory protein